MDDPELLNRFEAQRGRLRAVGYRMLGSLSDADDVVQEAWLRLDRTDAGAIQNLEGWLTTVVARLCLNRLRARDAAPSVSLDTHLPDPVVGPADGMDPEHEALTAEGVGLAMLVVLDTLDPAERLAFVLHDMFAVPFADIAPLVERSPTAARQLASRARRRVAQAPVPDADQRRQREVVDAYFAAARGGDFDGLLAVLDPDVVVRSDGGQGRPAVSFVKTGRDAVADQAWRFVSMARFVRPVLVNGAAGVVVARKGAPYAVMGFTVAGGAIVAIHVLADPKRLSALDPAYDGPHRTERSRG